MNIENLKTRKAQIEQERDEFAKKAQAQIERFTGAIAMLSELIDLETSQTEPSMVEPKKETV